MSAAIEYYKNVMIHRYDDNGYVKFFSANDFEGLQARSFAFESCGNLLKGYFYYYENCKCKKDSLIVFSHGIGGGHRSYLREIETLCREGYTIFSYDNTGCFESQGESMHCVSQVIKDLECGMIALKNSGELGKYKEIDLIVHSLAGLAAYNIQNYIECFDKIVVISGVISVENMVGAFIKNTTEEEKLRYAEIIEYEKNELPSYFESHAVENVNTKRAKFFIVHSKDDPIISFEKNYEYIRKNVTRNDVIYVEYEDKQHNPNYIKDAVEYMNTIFGAFNAELANGCLTTLEEKQEYMKDVDWYRMTAQDMSFWSKVFEFLK